MSLQSAVLEYVANEIKSASDRPNDWVLWNGAVIKIEDTLWDTGTKPFTQKHSSYSVQGTVSEALYSIEQNDLIGFLTAIV